MTRQNVTVSSGLADEAIGKLPHGGMAELLLEHAVEKSLLQLVACKDEHDASEP